MKENDRAKDRIRARNHAETAQAAGAALGPVLRFRVNGHRKRGQGARNGSRQIAGYAAMGLSAGKLALTSPQFPTEIATHIERLYRGVEILSTLKRDELVRKGRHEMFDHIAQAAIESKASIYKDQRNLLCDRIASQRLSTTMRIGLQSGPGTISAQDASHRQIRGVSDRKPLSFITICMTHMRLSWTQ